MNAPGSLYDDHSNIHLSKCTAVLKISKRGGDFRTWFCTRPKGHYGYHECVRIQGGRSHPKYLKRWSDDGKIINSATETSIKEKWNELSSITRQLILTELGIQLYDEGSNEWDDLSIITQIKIFRKKLSDFQLERLE